MRPVFYHCAIPLAQISDFFSAIFSLGANSSGLTQTLNLGIMKQVFYHCPTAFYHILEYILPYYHSIVGKTRIWVVLPLCYHHWPYQRILFLSKYQQLWLEPNPLSWDTLVTIVNSFCHFLSWCQLHWLELNPQPLNNEKVFYHHASTVGHICIYFLPYSLPMPLALARVKP